MKKKNIIKFGTSLALVAAIGAGATFAYLQSGVEDLTNTFTIGEGYNDETPNYKALVLDEAYNKDVGDVPELSPIGSRRTMFGNSYTVNPNTQVTKDPQVSLKNDSPDSYVFVKIEGVDNLTVSDSKKVTVDLNTTVDDEHWMKIANADGTELTAQSNGVDGIYVLASKGSEKIVTTSKENDQSYITFEKLFTTVTIPNLDSSEADILRAKMVNPIEIYAVAVQYVADNGGNYNITGGAKEQAINLLKMK